MENLIRVTFLAFILSVVAVGCGGGHKSETTVSQQTAEDTVVATVPQIVRGRVVEDTVIGHWTIKSLKGSNDVIVGRQDCAVRDSSVFLTLSMTEILCTPTRKFSRRIWSATRVNI